MFYVPCKPVNFDVARTLWILPAWTLLQPSQKGQQSGKWVCYDHLS